MTCTRRGIELQVTCAGNQVSWSRWGHDVVHDVFMDLRAHARGPGGDVAPPGASPSAEGLFSLWNDSDVDAIEERLASLLEIIRSWDWRASTFRQDGTLKRPATSHTRPLTPRIATPRAATTLVATPQIPTPRVPTPSDSPPHVRRLGTEPAFAGAGTRTHNGTTRPAPARHFESPSREAPWRPLPVDPRVVAASFGPPTSVVPRVLAPAPPPAVMAEPVESPPVPPPTGENETALEPSTRRWVKIVLWLVAALVVVIIVTIIRHSSPGQTPGSLTPETVKSGSSAQTPVVSVSATVLTQFTNATRGLDAANTTASQALASGSSMTVAQVTQAVSPYITALENFDFTVHFVVWPQSMQVPGQDLILRNQALVSFLQSITSENQATMSSWFSQLHALGNRAETADNLVRKDLGLAATSSYP
jgi:hypothetical protein